MIALRSKQVVKASCSIFFNNIQNRSQKLISSSLQIGLALSDRFAICHVIGLILWFLDGCKGRFAWRLVNSACLISLGRKRRSLQRWSLRWTMSIHHFTRVVHTIALVASRFHKSILKVVHTKLSLIRLHGLRLKGVLLAEHGNFLKKDLSLCFIGSLNFAITFGGSEIS